MALQTRLRRDLTNLLLSSPSYLNRLQVQRRSQLHIGGASQSQRLSCNLLLRLSCDVEAEGKLRRRDNGDCPSTKRASSIKQDAGFPALTLASASFRGDKPSAELLSARACRLPDKLIRDELPQGPWNPQRAPHFPPKCSPCGGVVEPCPPAVDCERDPCAVLDDPCGESRWTTTRDCRSFKARAERLLSRNCSYLQSRGLHVSGLRSGVGRGHSDGKSNRNESKKHSKKKSKSSEARKGKEICTKVAGEQQCYGATKRASSKKFTSCEPDVSWKRQHCLGDSRGSDTCSIDKPQCAERVGPTYREQEKSHEDKRMKAWKESKISPDKPAGDKCHPDDSWKESKTCTKSSESCSSGKPQCAGGGSKRSYSTLNFQSSRSFVSGLTLSRECDSGNVDKKERDKIASDIFKKEMQEIEECISASKCRVPERKTDKPSKPPKKGEK